MLLSVPVHGLALVDENRLPRYWACVWSMFHGAGLATSTHARKLRHIEDFYTHTESLGGSVDDLLSALDFEALGNALEAFFVKLRNAPSPSSTTQSRWTTVFRFVRDICERLERNPALGRRMAGIQERISQLDRLYLALRPYRKRFGNKPRALPRRVLSEMLEYATPGNTRNPFQGIATQWRVFALVSLLLYGGLRRGEALLLPADFLKSEVDVRTGRVRWFMSVVTNEAEDDTRANVPSVKTTQSIRTISVAEQTALGLLAYAEGHRGRVNHRFFLSSVRGLPLSLEGANKALQKLTLALSPEARTELQTRTGAKALAPHALRHTCAVVRTRQLLDSGKTPEETMMHLRSYFGWSKNSKMPLLYAKVALDERLDEAWDDQFDARLNVLRSIPE